MINASKSDGQHLRVLRTSADGTVYAEQDDGKVPSAIGTLDTGSGQFQKLFQDPVSEVSQMMWSTDDKRLIGVVNQAGSPKVTLLDEDHPDAALYQSLAQAFPGQMVQFSSSTEDGNRILVSVYSDTNPGAVPVRPQDRPGRFLLQGRDWLDPKRMASVTPFTVKARDGQLLHGYLTVPQGRKASACQ